MFIFKKVAAAFLLPPGLFVAALAWLAFYLRRRSRSAAFVCLALAAAMWGYSTKVFADFVLRPLEYAYAVPDAPGGDVIVVLCAGVRVPPAYFSAGEALDNGTLERAVAAVLLHKKTRLPIIVSGGAPFSTRPEALAAGEYLREAGVSPGSIITEEAARDTYENAVFTRKLCLEKGYKKVILLTSAVHMPRAVLSFRGAGFSDLVPFPVNRISVPGEKRFFRDYLPGNGGGAGRALNEYLGLVFYRLYYGLH